MLTFALEINRALAPLIQYLWTAALTPTITSYTQLQEGTVPRTGTGSYGFLNPRPPLPAFFFWECEIQNQANGSFTNCPGYYQSGTLLQSASSATTVDGSQRNHTKNDNSGYRYVGRSYGVGSSVGLTIHESTATQALAYNYTEDG